MTTPDSKGRYLVLSRFDFDNCRGLGVMEIFKSILAALGVYRERFDRREYILVYAEEVEDPLVSELDFDDRFARDADQPAKTH